ncbi:MAG TPA: toll/interleukin-1 receptor domain-containing protein, partial [Ktedonobacteraceae bacterium]|nr:toll/interleukin-1 receptor domain-containing protein [Ktedonobacteraceae bacterium]
MSSVKVVCCYVREDQPLLFKLRRQLAPLERVGYITFWADINISPGAEWEQELHARLNTAQIILILVSSSFIASDHCYYQEMLHAWQLHQDGKARVIPIILAPAMWQITPLGALQALPYNTIPVTDWPHPDSAFQDIAVGVRKVVEELRAALPDGGDGPDDPPRGDENVSVTRWLCGFSEEMHEKPQVSPIATTPPDQGWLIPAGDSYNPLKGGGNVLQAIGPVPPQSYAQNPIQRPPVWLFFITIVLATAVFFSTVRRMPNSTTNKSASAMIQRSPSPERTAIPQINGATETPLPGKTATPQTNGAGSLRYKGLGNLKTDPITITSDLWQMNWICDPNSYDGIPWSFLVALYHTNGTIWM